MSASSVNALSDALVGRLLWRLPPDRAYDRAALEAAAAATEEAPPLPRTVRHFLERMMRRRVEIEGERLQVLRQPWLDYEHEDVRRAEELLLASIHRHVRIPAEAWERVLRHACERVAAHLVRPVPALASFVFGAGGPDEPAALPSAVVERRLGYFAAYPYLHKAVEAYAQQRGVQAFPRERLTALLRRVDERMCASHEPEDWLRLLQPLFTLAAAAYPNHDGLPIDLIDAFFEEKKADVPLQHLRTARRTHDLDTLSPPALREIIAGELTVAAASSRASTEKAPRAETEPEKTSPGNAPSIEAPSKAAASDASPPELPSRRAAPPAAEESGAGPVGDAVPMWKRFLGVLDAAGGTTDDAPDDAASGHDAANAPAETAPPGADHADDDRADDKRSNEANGTADTDSGDPRPRWQQFGSSRKGAAADQAGGSSGRSSEAPVPPDASTRASASPTAPGEAASSSGPTSIERRLLGPAVDQRERFVQDLFGGSREAYERALHRLYDAEDWRSATRIIAEDVFRQHGVNIYSPPARAFTDAVEAHFH